MKENLFWAIVWTIMLVLDIVAIFWNPSHFLTAAMAAFFACIFWKEYRDAKRHI